MALLGRLLLARGSRLGYECQWKLSIPTKSHSFLTRSYRVSGLPYSYGVFERYYSTHEPFESQRGLAAIGTTGLVSWALLSSLKAQALIRV